MAIDLNQCPDTFKRYLAPDEKKKIGVAAATLDELISRQTIKTEKQFQNQVADYLRLRGIPFYRSRMDRRTTGKIGTPDFVACYRGRFIAFECKVIGNPATNEQEAELQAIRDAGGIAVLVFSLESVKAILDDIQGPTPNE